MSLPVRSPTDREQTGRDNAAVELSVVVPVFGCADCLPELHRRLTAALAPLTTDYEILLVDDASSDGAWAIILAMAGEDPCVRGLRLSRNFGQHAAITAGLAGARGRWTVVMDCDLQEPPELIPRLYAEAQEGFDVVHTVRRRRQGAMRRLAGALYFRVRNARTPRVASWATYSRRSMRPRPPPAGLLPAAARLGWPTITDRPRPC